MSLAAIEAVDAAWQRAQREADRRQAAILQLAIGAAVWGSADARDALRDL